MLKKLIFIFLLNAIGIVIGYDQSICNFNNGYSIDPHDCSRYFICNNNTATFTNCPSNKYFSKKYLSCVVKYLSDCSSKKRSPFFLMDTSKSFTTINCKDKPNGIYSDPDNCNKFYECENGTAYSGDCVGDLEWNSDLQKCDEPKNSDCTKEKLNSSTTTEPTTYAYSTTDFLTTEFHNDENMTDSTTEITKIDNQTTDQSVFSTDVFTTLETKLTDLTESTEVSEQTTVTKILTTEIIPTTENFESSEPTKATETITTELTLEPITSKASISPVTTKAPEMRKTTKTESTSKMTKKTLDPICLGQKNIKIADKKSCRHYYECDDQGLSKRKRCKPYFLKFHSLWKSCVPSSLVNCGDQRSNHNNHHWNHFYNYENYHNYDGNHRYKEENKYRKNYLKTIKKNINLNDNHDNYNSFNEIKIHKDQKKEKYFNPYESSKYSLKYENDKYFSDWSKNFFSKIDKSFYNN